MQRLAALERNGIADGPIKAQYEQVFLDMLYTMCTTPRPDAPEVRMTIYKMCCSSVGPKGQPGGGGQTTVLSEMGAVSPAP